eukprot:10027663-Alexandrium_andersonii.AAC.1
MEQKEVLDELYDVQNEPNELDARHACLGLRCAGRPTPAVGHQHETKGHRARQLGAWAFSE